MHDSHKTMDDDEDDDDQNFSYIIIMESKSKHWWYTCEHELSQEKRIKSAVRPQGKYSISFKQVVTERTQSSWIWCCVIS